MSKDTIYFLSKDELAGPLKSEIKRLLDSDSVDVGQTSFLPDGRINIECPCLHSALAHQCGHLMRNAISCFNASTKDPRGADCMEEFTDQAICMKRCEERK